jgi:hypothetical protein
MRDAWKEFCFGIWGRRSEVLRKQDLCLLDSLTSPVPARVLECSMDQRVLRVVDSGLENLVAVSLKKIYVSA